MEESILKPLRPKKCFRLTTVTHLIKRQGAMVEECWWLCVDSGLAELPTVVETDVGTR